MWMKRCCPFAVCIRLDGYLAQMFSLFYTVDSPVLI
uniref:Uncharacterized protein n=1 Tax=Anguilla anguilla TaxID=7936 RepID=A0A0E9Q2V1_ANGAN